MLSAGDRAVVAAGSEMPPVSETPELETGEIAFCRRDGENLCQIWSFGSSRVFATKEDGVLEERTVAAKRLLLKGPGSDTLDLEERLPCSVLFEAAAAQNLPLVWDFELKQSPISEDTVWRGGITYWVKDVTVSKVGGPVTLTIEPGATIKREPGTLFRISTNAKLMAVGEPYAMISFTNAGDYKCGEDVPTTNPTGRPSDLVEFLQGSTAGSTIRYCKFTRGGSYLVRVDTLQLSQVQNSVFLPEGSAYYAIYAPASGYGSLTFKNNLFVSPSTYAFIYAPFMGYLTLENNTFVNSTYGAWGAGTSTHVIAKENILFNVSDALYSFASHSVSANAYKPYPELSDPFPLTLSSSPFVSCGLLGDYYLATGSPCRNYVPLGPLRWQA